MTRTFHHRFKGGVTATLTFEVDDFDHSQGKVTLKECEWSKQPNKRIIPEYRRWQHAVYESLAKETKTEITHLIHTASGQMECWVYEPGKAGVLWQAGKQNL